MNNNTLIEPGEAYLRTEPDCKNEDKAFDLTFYLNTTRSDWLKVPADMPELSRALETAFNLMAVDYYDETGNWPCLYCGGVYDNKGKKCNCAFDDVRTFSDGGEF